MERLRRLLGPGLVPLLTLGCAALAALAGYSVRGTLGDPLVALLCAAGVVASEARPLHVAQGGERKTFTFAEAPLVIGLVVSTGVWLAAGIAVGMLIIQLARRLPPPKVLFNVAQYGAAGCVAVFVSIRVPGILGVLMGVVAFALVNDLAVQLVLRLTAGVRVGIPLADRGLSWLLHMAAAASGALLVGSAISADSTLAWAFVAPLVLLGYSQQEAMKQHVAGKVQRTIADQAVAAQGHDRRTTTRLVIRTARELMAAGHAELVLFDGPSPLLAVDDLGALSEQRLDPNWYESDGWYHRALQSGSGGVVDGRWAGVVIGDVRKPVALLAVTRTSQEAFRSADLVALRLLAVQAASWLSASLRQGDPGPEVLIDLTAQQAGAGAPRSVLDLLSELDVLRSSLDDLTPAAAWGRGLHELEAVQRRLTDAVSEVLWTSSHEEVARVSVGQWAPTLGRAEG